MTAFKNITREDVPCWYELSWDEKVPALTVSVHKTFAASVPLMTRENNQIVSAMMDQFHLKKFDGKLQIGMFGFDLAWKHLDTGDEFVRFSIPIPQVKFPGRKNCSYCRGTGKHPHVHLEKCPSCKGTKKDHDYRWNKVYAISATFTLFSIFSRYTDVVTTCKFPQLLTVQTMTELGQHGGSLGGEYSRTLCSWLASFPENSSLPEMEEAMLFAHKRMKGLSDWDKHSFRARLPYGNGWLNVGSPGDACGLHPSRGSVDIGEGYQFSCHNVDSAMQQITLLSGLAALHDKARKEIKS
jgi:hypothetical protein